MGYISFNLNYYKEKIEYYESKATTESDIYEAKQLLKLVDDLVDEGYFGLFDAMQRERALIDRLRAVITSAGELPFPTVAVGPRSNKFGSEKIELNEYIDSLILRARSCPPCADDGFTPEVKKFVESIEYDKSHAYVFLLRDTLLPYIYFKNRHAGAAFPLIISRGFTDLICAGKHADDVIRAVIFDALEKGYRDPDEFADYCKENIPTALLPFPALTAAVKGLLKKIESEKITVVETGCNGTFPMLLSALDERVEFKMYTTVPYLFKTYENNIFTTAYENARLFETLYCQNYLFKLTDFNGNEFFVSESLDKDIVEKSLREIRCFLQ